MKIKYEKSNCICVTDCIYKMHLSTSNQITKIGSQGCDVCTFNEGNDENLQIVDCMFRKERFKCTV